MKPLLTAALLFAAPLLFASERPNIVWIVGEDMGPEVRCFGDAQAITPNLDRLAAEGARFTRCFTHAAVCAPSRHGLITGQYPIKTGAHHMRSVLVQPPATFTKLLRDSGYHVSWPGKTDFNFKEPADFAHSREQWWKQDKPLPEPFFAYANFTESHESQVRNDGGHAGARVAKLPKEQRRKPEDMQLPPFWPDAPEVRTELARYYDLVTIVDQHAGAVLDWIEKQGFTQNTVVIFFGDHGRGMPRFKRWCYDSGLHTALIVRWPGKIEPGTVREDLVEFLDLPATSLALAGVEMPKSFDGQVFLGANAAPARKYAFAARDYMDETFDRIRSVRDQRYRYVRNFHPELPCAQVISYMEIGKTMQAWRRAHAEGKLNPVQSLFFAERKPIEELYDCEADPWQVHNLAADPQYAGKLAELRAACDAWLEKTADKGALSLDELVARKIIHPRNAQYEQRRREGPAALKTKPGN
jgi:uncharacterized sulfatase